MPHPTTRLGKAFFLAEACLVSAVIAGLAGMLTAAPGEPHLSTSDSRRTPMVEAIERASSAVVSIDGEKTVPVDESRAGHPENLRRVKGMGTGVIIDPRGYIITNHHVVDGVPKIQVTLPDETSYTAKLLSYDASADLAVIKIDAGRELPVIPIGVSSDLMLGETVIAIGNAYGYTHTVTHGIISSLHRSVQVNEQQGYDDVLQTDAAINPGNSGGPLLNIHGEMIGIVVAVRAGAQLIGFVIPVDKAMSTAADLVSTRRLQHAWHGVATKPVTPGKPTGLVVTSADEKGPAVAGGLRQGDIIKSVGKTPLTRPLDLERALLEHKPGEEVQLTVERDSQQLALKMVLEAIPSREVSSDITWDLLGMKLEPASQRLFAALGTKYRGGLQVTAVRPDGPAAQEGIRRGDILYGMHTWETVTPDNVTYILNHPDLEKFAPLKYYTYRGKTAISGHLTVSQRHSRVAGRGDRVER
jgi:serine protease Do